MCVSEILVQINNFFFSPCLVLVKHREPLTSKVLAIVLMEHKQQGASQGAAQCLRVLHTHSYSLRGPIS